jgi:hypothetical protein
VDDSHKCTTDVLPAIAALLHITMPWPGYDCSDDVHIAKFDGQPLSLPLDSLLSKRAAVLKEMLRRFGSGDWARTYRFGPEAGLIGKEASTLPSGSGSGKVSLRNDFSSVDPSADRVPVIVQGTVSGVSAGEPVAVAVNGSIEATGETFAYMGATRVAATIPVSSLRSGRNSVEVFRISGTGGSAKLQSMGGANL